uniref:ABC transporter permease n=1 Tax=Escherichia coli TaxID=562 RepID=UPI001FCF24FA
AYGPQNDVTLKMPAFEWVHVQLHQQKGMISLSPPTICNSAPTICNSARILIFTLSGLLAAVTGILLAARLGSGNAGAANGLEFDVIAAVVVGGTALSGGRGSLFGTLLGVLVITLIGNGLVLLGINSFFQQVVRGVIIVVAVLANILLTQRSSKAKR